MTNHPRPAVTPQLAIGLFITMAGLLLTLDRLGIVDAARSFRLWPIALILTGVAVLARPHDRKGRRWGFAWIFVGVWLLLNTLNVVRIGFWELLLPLAITSLGLKLVMDAMGRRQWVTAEASQWSAPGRSGPEASNLFAVMGETRRGVENHPFRGGSMTAFMGGCYLDLRQATVAPGEIVAIEVFAIMGGHEITVPNGWIVTSTVVPILGSVEDKRLMPIENPNIPNVDTPRLLLRGAVVMGGLTIKS